MGGGAPENWGIRYFFLDQKKGGGGGGSKDFFKLKSWDHLYIFF